MFVFLHVHTVTIYCLPPQLHVLLYYVVPEEIQVGIFARAKAFLSSY